MGGLNTVIGTSTNLVVQGLVLDEAESDPSVEEIGFFEPAYIGVPLGIVGMVYLMIFAPKLLPSRGGLFRFVRDRAKELLTEVRGRSRMSAISANQCMWTYRLEVIFRWSASG